jgi:hypothetical protein
MAKAIADISLQKNSKTSGAAGTRTVARGGITAGEAPARSRIERVVTEL